MVELRNLIKKYPQLLTDTTDKTSILINEPVLVAPDFNHPFKDAIDESYRGVDGVLLQEHDGFVASCKFLFHEVE